MKYRKAVAATLQSGKPERLRTSDRPLAPPFSPPALPTNGYAPCCQTRAGHSSLVSAPQEARHGRPDVSPRNRPLLSLLPLAALAFGVATAQVQSPPAQG